MAKKHTVTRTDLVEVQEHCPDVPYLELVVPDDAGRVRSIKFTWQSRDQGEPYRMVYFV